MAPMPRSGAVQVGSSDIDDREPMKMGASIHSC
jgi:hypothetical protein